MQLEIGHNSSSFTIESNPLVSLLYMNKYIYLFWAKATVYPEPHKVIIQSWITGLFVFYLLFLI